ncbi:MAG: ankyrin repeat domain-containing protein [Gemmatimonadetes bacterium]|nr:ankyrin repeat domain-containing protein [Gemmatimonadota bacterium]
MSISDSHTLLPIDDDLAQEVAATIREGEFAELTIMLKAHPELATARIVDERDVQRTLLHVATDWPGRFPSVAKTIALLVKAGADVDAGAIKPDGDAPETPLHWAASSDDVAAIDALLDHGANIEAPGAVFTNGTPISDAVVFGKWRAAGRLVERGAETTIWQAAALGLLDRVEAHYGRKPSPTPADITNAFWHACRGGHRATAEYLRALGADVQEVGPDGHTALQLAEKRGDADLIRWLREQEFEA